MKHLSFATKIGTTDPRRGAEVIVTYEPETGATLRTKGRLYLLLEVSPPGNAGWELARDLAGAIREEYYYDLSAGIEVSLRKAVRNANRRATQRIRDLRPRATLHCAAVVVVNNVAYAATVGNAQVFLVRHARLFLPGDEPGELADLVHRPAPRPASGLGAEPELLPAVWQQPIEAGDTIIAASAALVDAFGAEALKNAAVTLHPRAAADHVRNRFVAEGHAGSDAVVFIEVVPAPSAAQRVVSPSVATMTAPEVAAAETIRTRLDRIWRRRPRIGAAAKAVASPAATAVSRGVAIGLELMPRTRTPLPRVDTARGRATRQRRVTAVLALLLLLVTVGVSALVLRDFQTNQVVADYNVLIQRVEDDVASARRLISQQRPDLDKARERLAAASSRLSQAAASAAAKKERVAALRDEIGQLEDKIANVTVDLHRVAAGSKPSQLAASAAGVYVADPGAGRLWRVFTADGGGPPNFESPSETGAVLTKGQRGVGAPIAVATQGDVVYAIDDQRHVWKAQGNTVADVTPDGIDAVKSVTGLAAFVGNLYVLDAQSGQVWKLEEGEGKFETPVVFLTTALQPNTGRSVAVDGDVWIVTTAGEILRFRRQGLSPTAERIAFTARWEGAAVTPIAIQARDDQRALYLLDAAGKRIVRMSKDGRESGRFPLAQELPEPTSFYVSELQQLAFTAHGSKLAITDISR